MNGQWHYLQGALTHPNTPLQMFKCDFSGCCRNRDVQRVKILIHLIMTSHENKDTCVNSFAKHSYFMAIVQYSH